MSRILGSTTVAALAALLVLGAPSGSAAQGIAGGLTGESTLDVWIFGGAMETLEVDAYRGQIIPASAPTSVDRVVNLSVGARAAPTFGIAIGWAVSPHLDVRVTGTRARKGLDLTGVIAETDASVPAVSTVGELAEMQVFVVHADLLWRLASRESTLSPYLFGGIGLDHSSFDDLSHASFLTPVTGLVPRTGAPGVQGGFSPAGAIGLGADLGLRDGVTLRLELTDHVASNTSALFRTRFARGIRDAPDWIHHPAVLVGAVVHLGG